MAGWLHPYRFRQKLVIQSAYVDAALTGFPVLIVTDKVQSGNDKKLAVTTSDGTTQCPVEVEKSDASTAILWSKVPSISASSDTTIYLYYDNAVADNDAMVGYVNTAAGAAVWDSNFVLVNHMQDYGDTSHTVDSTSNNNDGIKAGAGVPNQGAGKIGYAQDCPDTTDNLISISDNVSLDFEKMTVEALCYPNGSLGEFRMIAGRRQSGKDATFYFAIDNLERLALVIYNPAYTGGPANTLLASQELWQYMAVSWDGDVAKYYLNTSSQVVDFVDNGNIRGGDSALYLGDDGALGGYRFNGLLDEIRISNIKRSDAWVKASYYSETDTLLVYDSTETREAVTPQPPHPPAPTPPIPISFILRLKDWLEAKVAE